MLTKNEILLFLNEYKTTFITKFHIINLGLFGSFARGEQTENSDIDLLIELRPQTPDIFELKQELRKTLVEKFNRQVDICTGKYIKPIFKPFILSEVIYVY